MFAVSYGGGTNSTAMLCGFRESGLRPALITFADTGAEMPHTYDHLESMRETVRSWWDMDITIVRTLYRGKFEGLDGQCERRSELPGLAYGRKSCSIKYKGQPQDKALRVWAKKSGPTLPVTKAIGFDAGESHRLRPTSAEPDLWVPWYPLVEWLWTRDECRRAICRHGLPLPGKSACYFCPASKKSEVVELRKKHPALYEKAIAIEDAAQDGLATKRGLGGQGNLWRTWMSRYDAQDDLGFDMEPTHIACDCYDG